MFLKVTHNIWYDLKELNVLNSFASLKYKTKFFFWNEYSGIKLSFMVEQVDKVIVQLENADAPVNKIVSD